MKIHKSLQKIANLSDDVSLKAIAQ